MPKPLALTPDTIERARALIPRGTSLYRLARELGYKVLSKKAKRITEQLERLIAPPQMERQMETMLNAAHSALFALRHRGRLYWKSEEAVTELCDELLELLTSEEKLAMYRKMDDTYARWVGSKRKIEDDEDHRVFGERSRVSKSGNYDEPGVSQGGAIRLGSEHNAQQGTSSGREVSSRAEHSEDDQDAQGRPAAPPGWI